MSELSSDEIVRLTREYGLYEWSAQRAVKPLSVDRAKGVYFWTVDGQRFLDFNSQLMCVNIGHGDERVIRAIRQQAEKLSYAMPLMATEPRARLHQKLAEISRGGLQRSFFTLSGAVANESEELSAIGYRLSAISYQRCSASIPAAGMAQLIADS
jgi:taurine--2-oxoglutarate transaminase